MSFGRPPSFSDFTASPPDRGSFPLDHFGECKDQMMGYLTCLRKYGSNSTPCRVQGKGYLECRMSKGLMERDEWHNLGMGNVPDLHDQASPAGDPATSGAQTAQPLSTQPQPRSSAKSCDDEAHADDGRRHEGSA